MNHRLSDIQLRRGQLLERIAAQRATLGRQLSPVQRPLYKADCWLARISSAGTYLKRHPSIVALGTAALFLLKTERVWQWSKRGFLAWQSWRALRDSFSAFGSRARSWATPTKT